jgi:hypothetical protein
MSRIVSDDVWQRLDRRAGRLSRRTARRLTLAIGAVLALIAAASVVQEGGLLLADLKLDGTSSALGPEIGIQLGLTMHNDGWTPITVVGAGADAPGLHLVSVDAPDPGYPQAGRPFEGFPTTLAPGQTLEFRLAYAVTNCDAVPPTLTVPVRVRRWWGTGTVALRPTFSPSNDPAWLRGYGQYVCGRIDAPP